MISSLDDDELLLLEQKVLRQLNSTKSPEEQGDRDDTIKVR